MPSRFLRETKCALFGAITSKPKEEAALELVLERGYERATVAEITERAGLTKRTFFRHFADKREVLFSGQETLYKLFVGAIVGAPASATAINAIGAETEAQVQVAWFDDAIAMAEKACALASGSGEQDLLKRNQELLALYRNHQPYHEMAKP